ncbi:MAG: hypothetical protein AMJ46_03565 [Latescibacteria bacterium DG_63]|nr:MAG: hypothetical protein AMJ46_03565 [Latescibacteria bacterium DG_63]
MTRLLLTISVTLTLGLFLIPFEADALPLGSVGYKVYHYEDSEWVRYHQGDPFPPGGADPGTNLWKYTYCPINLTFSADIYQFLIFFNSDNEVDRAQYVSAAGPEGWSSTYFPPVSPNVNWKVRFRASNAMYYIAVDDTLCGFEVQITWTDPTMLPPQNYDLVCSGESEPGVTHELPPDITPVETTTWGRLKSLFLR